MEHEHVEQHDIVSRYLRRSLTPGEVQDFEAHFIDCADCQDALDHESGFQDALKRVLPSTASAPSGSGRTAGWLAAAAVLALAASGSVAYLRMRHALEDASSRVRVLEQQVAEARVRADAPMAMAVFDLTDTDVTRSAAGAADATVVAVPSSASIVVLSLQVQNAGAYRQFRAELVRAAPTGRDESSVWRGDPLFRSSSSSVGVGVPSAVLQPGAYHVILEGVTPDGRSLEVGRFQFRVAAR